MHYIRNCQGNDAAIILVTFKFTYIDEVSIYVVRSHLPWPHLQMYSGALDWKETNATSVTKDINTRRKVTSLLHQQMHNML